LSEPTVEQAGGELVVVRDEGGRIVSGALNPGGKPRRPPTTSKEFALLCSQHTPMVVAKMVAIVEACDPKKPTMIAFKAAEFLANRGHGLPVDERQRMEYDALAVPDELSSERLNEVMAEFWANTRKSSANADLEFAAGDIADGEYDELERGEQ
jgi:hypothetical protein